VLDGILLEKAGIPSISIVTDAFVETGKVMASNWGVPEYLFLSIPHPIGNLSDAELEERVNGVLDDVVKLLKDGQTLPDQGNGAHSRL
jgi:hypothetical protein